MYYALLALTGGLVSLMLAANGELSQAVGIVPAMVLVHLSGVFFSLPAVRLDRQPALSQAPLWLYLPGLIGVASTWANIYCATRLGVTMTLSLQLLGQLLSSLIVDASGVLGTARQPLSPARLLTLGLAALGCLLMAEQLVIEPLAIGLALGSGLLLTLTSAMNALLGSYIGAFRAVRVNFLTGLLGSLLIFALSQPELGPLAAKLLALPWYISLGGGVCGVLLVAGMNLCLPRVSILYCTLIRFLGQLAVGLGLSLLAGGVLSSSLLSGGLVMALALSCEGLSQWLSRLKPSKRAADYNSQQPA